jgi:hypothetical protein
VEANYELGECRSRYPWWHHAKLATTGILGNAQRRRRTPHEREYPDVKGSPPMKRAESLYHPESTNPVKATGSWFSNFTPRLKGNHQRHLFLLLLAAVRTCGFGAVIIERARQRRVCVVKQPRSRQSTRSSPSANYQRKADKREWRIAPGNTSIGGITTHQALTAKLPSDLWHVCLLPCRSRFFRRARKHKATARRRCRRALVALCGEFLSARCELLISFLKRITDIHEVRRSEPE